MDGFTEWLGEHAWQSWTVLAVVLGALEMLGLELFLVMLAGGAVVGAVTAAVGAPFLLQLGLALITSVALLGLVRPSVLKRINTAPSLRLGHQTLIGQRALVQREVSAKSPGRVKVSGEEWTALPYDEDDSIEVGATVDVVLIKGATAYVLRTHDLEA
jgi:membrane protein implicated in regulation of membrane protease activity